MPTCSFGWNLSELGGTVCKSNIELSSTSDNSLSKLWRVSILMNAYLLAAEMFWAISAQWVLLFMRSNSMSFSQRMRSFLKPLGRMCWVFLSCLEPITGMRTVPLNLLLTEQSTPLGFLQDLCAQKWWVIKNWAWGLSWALKLTYTNAHEAVTLESVRVFHNFLDDLASVQWLDCHYFIFNTHLTFRYRFIPFIFRHSTFIP